jgi:hypothetical protein
MTSVKELEKKRRAALSELREKTRMTTAASNRFPARNHSATRCFTSRGLCST